MANRWRMRHTWRNGYLKVAHCAFLMTSRFYSLIFCLLIFFLFALHLYFSVENRTSEGDFRRKLLKYFCFIRSDCAHCTPFFDKKKKKKCAKMRFFLCENRKNPLAAGGFTPRPSVVASLCQILSAPLSGGVKLLEKPRPNTKRPGEPLRPSPLNIHK